MRKRWPVGRGEEWFCKREHFSGRLECVKAWGPGKTLLLEDDNHQMTSSKKMQVEIKYFLKSLKLENM